MLNKHNITILLFISILCLNMNAQDNINDIILEANIYVYENPDSAIEVSYKILELANIDYENKIEALLLLSTAYSSKRNYEKSLVYAQQALQLLPNTENNAFKIKVYNKIGTQYQQLKIYDKSLTYLDYASELTNNTYPKDSLPNKVLGYNYATRGFIYREQMSCDIALNYFNKALYYYKKTLHEKAMNANISIINYNKGNCFVSLNQIDSARYTFNTAIHYAQIIEANSLLGFAHKGLAEVLTAEGKYYEAIKTLEKGMLISSNVGDLVLNQGLYKGLSDNYLAINNTQKHHYFLNKFEETQLQIKTTETNTINQSIKQIKEETASKVNLINSKNNLLKIFFKAVIFLLSLLIVFEIFYYTKTLRSIQNQQKRIKHRIIKRK